MFLIWVRLPSLGSGVDAADPGAWTSSRLAEATKRAASLVESAGAGRVGTLGAIAEVYAVEGRLNVLPSTPTSSFACVNDWREGPAKRFQLTTFDETLRLLGTGEIDAVIALPMACEDDPVDEDPCRVAACRARELLHAGYAAATVRNDDYPVLVYTRKSTAALTILALSASDTRTRRPTRSDRSCCTRKPGSAGRRPAGPLGSR